MNALWLVDAAYVFQAQRTVLDNFELDLERSYSYLKRQLGMDRISLHVFGNRTQKKGLDRFYHWLRLRGHTVHLRSVKYELLRGENPETGEQQVIRVKKQSGVDVAMATVAGTSLYDYDTLILTTGDVDLLPVVETWLRNGKNVKIFAFRKGLSQKYQEIVAPGDIILINGVAGEVGTARLFVGRDVYHRVLE